MPRDAVIWHGAQICESILDEQQEVPLRSPLFGTFELDGRTCPTATRLEGLLAARKFLPIERAALGSRIELAIDRGIAFLVRAQVTSGESRGGIPRAFKPLADEHPEFDHAFNRRATEVRIDYVQHALSAMLSYQQWRYSRESATSPERS